ncbi:WD40 repeat-like protein [Imleria badia]|nr:WD40 repeat-like protein [Imleria badia]
MNTAKTIEIRARNRIRSLVFLEDGRHLLSADDEGMIRRWRCEDGREVGEVISTSSGLITAMALSGDGNWIVSSGWQVANVLNRKSQACFAVNAHTDWVDTVHVSPDSTKFATGANDKKAFIWDILTGKKVVGPLDHDDRVRTVRFSPTGDRIATSSKCLRIYDAYNGDLLSTITVSVASYASSNLIAWSGVQNIFAFSSPNTLSHIHVNARQTLSTWTIPNESSNFGYIVLSSNGRFIASFVGRSISLWDTSTYAQISSVIIHPVPIWSIALSLDNHYLATSDANGIITLRNLNHIIPNYYQVGESVVQQLQTESGADLESQTEAPYGKLRAPELQFGDHLKTTTKQLNLNDRFQVQAIALRISDGTYHIKSITGDLYLSCSQSTPSTVVVQKLDQSSVFHRVCHRFIQPAQWALKKLIWTVDCFSCY